MCHGIIPLRAPPPPALRRRAFGSPPEVRLAPLRVLQQLGAPAREHDGAILEDGAPPGEGEGPDDVLLDQQDAGPRAIHGLEGREDGRHEHGASPREGSSSIRRRGAGPSGPARR